MVCHKEFQDAGKKPGLTVWRVEKGDLKEIPKELYGIFYTGDTYIVLNTTAGPSYSAHMWQGSESTVDEKAAACIFLIQLDESLNGDPIQYREVQNNESTAFMGYFKSGVTYKKGGVASALQQVVTNEMNIKRLLQVQGRRVIRATEVIFAWESFTKNDCFIIDLGQDIFLWQGEECNPFERFKASQVAIEIRDNERAGRSNLHMIEDGSEPDSVIEVLGPKPDITSIGPDDQTIDMANKNMASLYVISDAAGAMKTTLVAEKNPFKQEMLSNSECYILDNGADKKIFVWKGPDANPSERKAALKAAEEFIKEKNYSEDTQIQVMPAHAESALFKQFFSNFLDKYETVGPGQACVIGHIAHVEQVPFDASTLHSNNTMAAQYGMVDDGSGDVKVWRVEGGDKVPVESSSFGQFYGGDCYLVLYSYNLEGKQKHIIYTWQGLKCTRDELGASAILTLTLDHSMSECQEQEPSGSPDQAPVTHGQQLSGSPLQVRVTQGQEPAHLVSLFKKQTLVVYLGGTSRKGGQTQAGTTQLFHIRRSSTKATRAVEVEPSAGFLNTNDVFVLKSPDSLFVWKGIGAIEEEMVAAKYVTGLLGGTVTEVDEGKEPDGFWSALGGKKDYQTSKGLQEMVKPPRLFGCSNKTGRLIAEEVPGDFTQVDIATDDIMILDTYYQIFLWIGKDANEVERTGAAKIAQDYIDSDPSGRSGIPITTIRQGSEPPTFTGWFLAWDPKMWETDPLACIRDSN